MFAFATPFYPPRLAKHASRAGLVLVVLALASTVLAAPASAQTIPKRCQIIGTDGPDVLTGTSGDDIICGLGGDDVILGLAGDDEILGGSGNDLINGGAGDDAIRGDGGRDVLIGAQGRDVLRGGNDDDHLVGGSGDDELRGGNGDDRIAGGVGADVLRGGNGNDLARGAGGNDTIFGGSGDDIIKGGAGNDRLRGGPGVDICQDSFIRTNAINCEFGKGGDDSAVSISRQIWNLRGNVEFVYSMTITKPCPSLDDCGVPVFAETVYVNGPEATSSFGAPAFTAAELFDEAALAAEAGRKVVYHPNLGLPTHIDNAQGGSLRVEDIDLRDELRARFVAARSAWVEAGLTDYSYTVTTSCFCPFIVPIRVSVTDGSIVSGEPLGQGAQEWSGGVQTIEQHFDDLAELLDGAAIEVHAEFDSTYGLPLIVSVDVHRQIADEERSIAITDFVDASEGNDVADVGEEIVAPALPGDGGEDVPRDPDPEEPAPADGDPETPGIDTPEVVSVRGIQVSVEIAAQVEALLDAAEASGFVLSGGGFRDPQRQIELRKKNCGTSDFAIFEMPADQCNPPTARPGQSQHEKGLAIDFTSAGRLITSTSDPAFIWLTDNAPGFGFINLPGEPWHWSTTGN